MKRISALLAVLLAALLVPVALAASNETMPAPPPNVYCLNGEAVSMPAPVSFGDGALVRNLSQTTAEILITDPEFNGMFWVGYLKNTTTAVIAPPNLRSFLADIPAPSFNTVARGACAGLQAQPDRNFWLCYSKFQVDPAVYSRSEAVKNFDDGKGMWVPYAAKAPVSKTSIGNGVYLTCSIPSGYAITGNAVSTGGGEPFNGGLYAKVPMVNRLDYTVLLARA